VKTKSRTLPGGEVDAGTKGATHTEDGAEILDQREVAVPLRFRGKAVTSYQDAMSLLSLASRLAESEGLESEEEANDFEVDDEDGFENFGSSVFTPQDEREILAIQRRVGEEQRRRREQGTKPPDQQNKADVKKEIDS